MLGRKAQLSLDIRSPIKKPRRSGAKRGCRGGIGSPLLTNNTGQSMVWGTGCPAQQTNRYPCDPFPARIKNFASEFILWNRKRFREFFGKGRRGAAPGDACREKPGAGTSVFFLGKLEGAAR